MTKPSPVIKFTPFPILKTERLTLRQLQPADAQQIYTMRNDEVVAKYVNRPLFSEIDEAHQFIQRVNNNMANEEWIMWAITQHQNNQLMGTICLWNISKETAKAEIGYEMLPLYHGQGIMQEALVAVLDYGFGEMRLNCIDAYFHQDNDKSRRLLERNGFSKSAYIQKRDPKDEYYILVNNRQP